MGCGYNELFFGLGEVFFNLPEGQNLHAKAYVKELVQRSGNIIGLVKQVVIRVQMTA